MRITQSVPDATDPDTIHEVINQAITQAHTHFGGLPFEMAEHKWEDDGSLTITFRITDDLLRYVLP